MILLFRTIRLTPFTLWLFLLIFPMHQPLSLSKSLFSGPMISLTHPDGAMVRTLSTYMITGGRSAGTKLLFTIIFSGISGHLKQEPIIMNMVGKSVWK